MTELNDITDTVRRIARNERAAWREIYRSAAAELAAPLGCELACCQTLASRPAQRNMAQAGFQNVYTQQNILTPRVRG
jgi:hypothetical protein